MGVKKRFHPASPPAALGNTLAVSHGAGSEAVVAPIRERHLTRLQEEFPKLDPRTSVLLASRLAKIEVIEQWLDERGLFKSEKNGELWPVLDRLERWSRRAEDLLARAEAQRGGKTVVFDLAQAMSGIAEASNG